MESAQISRECRCRSRTQSSKPAPAAPKQRPIFRLRLGRRSAEKASLTLEEYADDKGYQLVKHLDVDGLREFRQRWKDAPLTARKSLERLRASFRFAQEAGWVTSNPALPIKPPLLHDKPTLPLDDEELGSSMKWAPFSTPSPAPSAIAASGSWSDTAHPGSKSTRYFFSDDSLRFRALASARNRCTASLTVIAVLVPHRTPLYPCKLSKINH